MLVALLIVVLAIVALLAYAATRPATFRIERSTRIAAAPERIAAVIVDFHRWQEWSPWERLDPSLQRSFSGAPSGLGAVYAWSGNSKAGTGRMEVLSWTPQRVEIKLDFFKPFKASNTAEFTLVPDGPATNVHWAMFGPRPFISKLMGMFIDMDALVGKDFEAGLVALKQLAERAA